MNQSVLSFDLCVTIFFLTYVIATSEGQKVNLTAVFDHRLVQLLRQTSSAFSQRQKSDRDLKVILNELELQNAKPGDVCDRHMWTEYMKPIYEALFQENFIIQKSKNDDFAVAILKDKTVMTKVCMSATEVLECNAGGKCDCLSILPSDLKVEFPCGITRGDGDSPGLLNSLIFQNPVLLWAKQIFGGTNGGSPSAMNSISIRILTILSILSILPTFL